MDLEAAALGELLGADRTDKWLFAGMRAYVVLESRYLGERLLTKLTNEWLLVGMESHVIL